MEDQPSSAGDEAALRETLQKVLHEHGDWFSFRISLIGAYYWRELTPRLAGEFGLLRDDFVVLAYLCDYGALTANVIATVSSRPKNSISRSVAKLTRLGLVSGRQHEKDRRFVLLQVQDEGRAVYERSLVLFREWEESVFGFLEPGEREALDAILAKVQDRLHRRVQGNAD